MRAHRAPLVFLGTRPGSDLGRGLGPVSWRPVLSRERSLPLSQGSRPGPEMVLHLKTSLGGKAGPQRVTRSHSACAHSSGAAGSWAGACVPCWGRTSPLPGGLGEEMPPRATPLESPGEPESQHLPPAPSSVSVPSRGPASAERQAGGERRCFQRYFAFS